MDRVKLICYVCGVINCFCGLPLFSYQIQHGQSGICGIVLIIIGVILLLFSYTNDEGGF